MIPNCVDSDAYAAQRKSVGEVRIAFVGTVGKRKGVPDLLSALERIEGEFVCDIVGGPGEESPESHAAVVRQAAGLVTAGKVVLHGELDREQVRELLGKSSIFVLPSLAEGLPVALLEAMACSLPVVVTDVGVVGEVVRDADCGLVVPPADQVALAQALDLLLSDAALRERLGAAARRAALATYDCDRTFDELESLYRSVAAQG